MEELTINSKKAKDVAVILYEKFNSEEGIFGQNIMPEDLRPRWDSNLSASGIERGSYEHLVFITMVVSIDYQRDADQLWEAGRRTFEDKETRWLFVPAEVIKRDSDEIMKAMEVHKLSKKHKQDPKIWFNVSKSMFELYDSNPLNMIKEYNYDAFEIFNKKFDRRFKMRFPFLSGNKIFPLWIRMLHDSAGVELKNLFKVPIPVDVHIARATFTTGGLTGRYRGTIDGIFPEIDKAWARATELIKHPGLKYRLQLDEPLCHLSREGCKYRRVNSCPKREKCPVREFCVKGTVNISAGLVEVNTWDT